MATTKALELSQLAKGITVDASGNITAIAATTDVISEGSSNLYYTTARANADFDTKLAAADTGDLSEGSNLYYTQARFDTAFAAKDTGDLSEGSNLYYTQARFDTAFAAKDTDGLSEGSTNLYYTDARVGSYLTTNTYATQSYVDTAVTNLVDSAPTTLDTLNELAAALGDDPNFATTITTSIGTKWTQDNTKISNWDTAYSWGDHSSAGYLTSFTETDPIFSAHTTSNISNGTGLLKNDGSGNWTYDSSTYLTTEENDLTSAVTWANVPDANITESSVTQHEAALTITESQISDLQSYLTSFTETDPVFLAHPAANVTSAKINNWDTAYSWGDHSTAGYGTVDDATALAIALG